MELEIDAISTVPQSLNLITSFSEYRINKNALEEIKKDLDIRERISIMFLMTDRNTDISEIIQLIENDEFNGLTELSKKNNWAEKLLESLIIIQNIDVIRKLGYNAEWIEAMQQRFSSSIHRVTENINRVIKSLYFLCDNLIQSEVKKLINKFNDELNIPIQLDENKTWLELYILYWLKHKYITIDEDNPNLDNLLKCLKDIGCSCDSDFFDDWKVKNNNQQDSTRINENGNSLIFVNDNSTSNQINEDCVWTKDHKRLCIIVNIMNFQRKYKMRKGSNLDERNLEEAFRGCQFEIEKHFDLTKEEMLEVLNKLNKPPYNEYGSIFMCILSHGSSRQVIFSDNEELSIDEIEERFCCSNLEKAFKLVILQSCQGTKIGTINPTLITKTSGKLVTDGPVYGNPLHHLHFGRFLATINNFVSLRHETEGSWFIQDICHELRYSTPISATEWAQKVIRRVSSRNNKDIVQVPRFESCIPVDYTFPKYKESC